MGLLLGASIVTIFEVLDFFIHNGALHRRHQFAGDAEPAKVDMR